MGFHNYRPFLCLLLHAAGVLLHISVLLSPALSALLQAHSALYTVALLLLPWLMLLTGGELFELFWEPKTLALGWAPSHGRRGVRLVLLANALGTQFQCHLRREGSLVLS